MPPARTSPLGPGRYSVRGRGLRSVGLGLDQGSEAVVVLTACRTALEVGAHPRNRRTGICATELELDIAIELLEALRERGCVAPRIRSVD